ncbi:hypothetical protein [Sphaerospermopsis torques-reginae]|jgi:hypothetical protein|nr:hypothetical protein [Sphaerospermopsis torques-reginae]
MVFHIQLEIMVVTEFYSVDCTAFLTIIRHEKEKYFNLLALV